MAYKLKKSLDGFIDYLGASIFSSITNKIIRKADETSDKNQQPTPKSDINTEDFELNEIQYQKYPTSKIPIPTPRTEFAIDS